MATITCTKCGQEKEQMAEAPRGKSGAEIQANVCAECWGEWRGQQLVIMNHYGLQMNSTSDREQLQAIMREFLNLPAEQPA